MKKYVDVAKIKEVLKKLNSKKSMIESSYFQSLTAFNNMLKVEPDNPILLTDVSRRKENLDETVNSAISYLDNLIYTLTIVLKKVSLGEQLINEQSGNFIDGLDLNNKNLVVSDAKDESQAVVAEQIQDLDYLTSEVREYAEVSDEFNKYLDQINQEFQYYSPKEVKQGLLNDQEYNFEAKLSELEENFKKELDIISSHNKILEEQNTNLQSTLNKIEDKSNYHLSSLYNKRTWDDSELYFSALDKSVNNAVEKFDQASEKMTNAINVLSINQIENLEKISLPLIKSLEKFLKTITNDFSTVQKENQIYRKQLDDYKNVIFKLKTDNQSKDDELKNSYNSWLANVRKISELEEILNEQSDDIKRVYEEKNDLISRLENKISETGNFVNQIIYEKELLLQQNTDLYREIDSLRREKAGENELDEYINAVSVEDIVSKEANKIVESKMQGLMEKYQSEIEQIKNNSISYFMNVQENEERVLEKLVLEKNDDKQGEIIKSLEKKLANLEKQLKNENRIREKTEDTINDLNQLLAEGPYSMIDQEKTFLSNKFNLLEQKIEESLERVKYLEDEKSNPKNNVVIDESELNDLFLSSQAYQDFNQQLLGKELEIDALKAENKRIHNENIAMNSILDETIKKITINSSKMKDLEELLTKQDYEFMILNDEKNSVIESLYNAIKDRDLTKVEDINNLKKLDKYDFSDFAKQSLNDQVYYGDDLLSYVKEEVEKIISKEIESLKNQYEADLKAINSRYEGSLTDRMLNQPTQSSQFIKEIVPIATNYLPRIDDRYFDVGDDLELKKDLKNYFANLSHQSPNEISEEIIYSNKNSDSSEFIGEGKDILDISINGNAPWNFDEDVEGNGTVTKILHEKIESNTEKDLVTRLSNRNDDLENKIKNLQKIISDKFADEIYKNHNPNKLNVQPFYFDYQSATLSQDVKNQILNQQLIQSSEIDKKIQDSINALKQENNQQISNLSKKIDNIVESNNNIYINDSYVDSSVDSFEIMEDRSSLYLEREIIDSTDKLLKLQKELLSLESEIINEEKRIIVEL
ncbi:MAG: hypothetical protein K2J02_01540 [Malacoplasma sp.]|nr:hypothetical protein [Malacoplasma sp.]